VRVNPLRVDEAVPLQAFDLDLPAVHEIKEA
jgi:O-methyltransferase involved in polyketide biosynthesis